MWVCFNNAFVSAVADPKRPGMLKVRARKREHLARLFPDAQITASSTTDYRYRVFVTKTHFSELLARKAMEIDYGNFKSSVKDRRLHDLYLDFWRLHLNYQEEKPA